MDKNVSGVFLIAVTAMVLCGCTRHDRPLPIDKDFTQQIDRLVEVFLTSANDVETERALGIPSVGRVGDASSYGFVLVNMLRQPPGFRVEFLAKGREAAMRHETA
jgi:hypothetical protein